MTGALAFGAIASSSLLLGAMVGSWVTVPKRLLAAMLAFAAGALITALTFELFAESVERGGIGRAAAGLAAGALVFTLLSARLDKAARAGTDLPPGEEGSDKLDTDAAAQEEAPTPASTHGGAGLALLGAVILDGVPESIALGIAFSEGTGGLALLAAIFVSNFPEALVGAASMRAQARSHRYVLALWGGVGAVLVIPVVLGAGPLSQASGEAISLPLAFAAGAVLASLADTLMPEAYEDGGPTVALATTAGFLLSFVLSLR